MDRLTESHAVDKSGMPPRQRAEAIAVSLDLTEGQAEVLVREVRDALDAPYSYVLDQLLAEGTPREVVLAQRGIERVQALMDALARSLLDAGGG